MSAHVLPVLTLLALAFTASGAVVGRVVENRSGTPLANAEVRIFRAGTLAADLETDSGGNFRADLPDAEYRLDVSKPNYVRASIVTAGKQATPGLVIRLIRCAAIEGRAAEHESGLRTRLDVYAFPASRKPAYWTDLVRQGFGTNVANDGRYRISGLPPGQYVVGVVWSSTPIDWEAATGVGSGFSLHPDNRAPKLLTLSEGEELRGVDFHLTPVGLFSIGGTVNAPAAGGRFRLALALADAPGIAYGFGRNDVDGAFQFRSVASGSYTLLAAAHLAGDSESAAEWMFARMPVQVSGDVEGISVAPQKGRSVSFVLRTRGAQTNVCPRTAVLTLDPMGAWGTSLRRTLQLTAGTPQKVDQLAPDRYLMSVDAGACYAEPELTVDLRESTPAAPVEVWIAPPGSVDGHLEGAEQNQSYSVALLPADPNPEEPFRTVLANSGFRFRFDGLRPGLYRIAVQSTADTLSNGWRLDPGRLVDITVCGGCAIALEFPAPKANSVTSTLPPAR